MRQFLIGRARVLLTTAVLAASAGALAALPSAAVANSSGCTTAGSGLPWYGLNSAYTCITVKGSGHWVHSVTGEWMGIGTLCNYRFRIRFWNAHGKLYEAHYSPTHTGCRAMYGSWAKPFWNPRLGPPYVGQYKKTGMVCVQVLENGRKVGHAACESIF